ncbi:MAG TPA: CDP-alcohol phosphatidyltransferase family protein [Candidatus Udaeobacter sp.]|nr:CDP-alcohol phosphatidyltransferase family protein [Candidatus Udaeobacter sp.]
MPSQVVQTTPPKIESTFKARDVEGAFDLYFYRPIGFWLAQIFARLKLTPTGVSFLAGISGVIAGHLYYYRNLSINVVGMVLHVCANTLDNADGQLARLTHQESREGRIIDSIADHLVFVSIYVHLTLRYLVEGSSPAVCVLALAAGVSHALQGAAADYYRNTYLYFVTARRQTDLDSSSELHLDYRKLTWRQAPWRKLLLALYLNFTRQQEMLAPRVKALRALAARLFHNHIPDEVRTRYRNLARPMLKWWGLLMTNVRMLVLFALLFISQPVYYFWFELIPLNLLFVYLLFREEKMAGSMLNVVESRRNSV